MRGGRQELVHGTHEHEKPDAVAASDMGHCVLLCSSPGLLGFTGEKLAKDARIGIAEARAIALKAHPGKITDEELESEAGGGGLRDPFDIKTATGRRGSGST